MRPQGKLLNGSAHLLETQECLVNSVGNALCLTHFTPARRDHLGFVNLLLKEFCSMDICCALVGTYPAYIAGVLSSYYVDELRVSQLCIARTDSPILENIYRKVPSFTIGPYKFHLNKEDDEYASFPDYSVYEITHDGVTVPFHFTVVDVAVKCGSKSNINLAEFIWENASIFTFKMYGIVCVPSGMPSVLYLHHHGATSGDWTPDTLCKKCLNEFKPIFRPFICDCTGTPSCKCNVCLRQAPSLRSLASYTVFRLTFNLSEFKLTRRTLYHQCSHAVKTGIVPLDRLIPITFPKLQCTYVHGQHCDASKRFHKACTILLPHHWGTYCEIHCDTYEEAVATLCIAKDWWCDNCKKPLFKVSINCVFF